MALTCTGLTKFIFTALVFYWGVLLGRESLDIEIDCPAQEEYSVEELTEVPKCGREVVKSECSGVVSNIYYLRKNIYGTSVFQSAFGALRHPSSPAKSEFVITQSKLWPKHNTMGVCDKIIMTRTGSRDNQPNKCVAVAIVPESFASPRLISHRIGFSARLTNQYQNDYIRQLTLPDEFELLHPLMVGAKRCASPSSYNLSPYPPLIHST